jgi:hypothetical protein
MRTRFLSSPVPGVGVPHTLETGKHAMTTFKSIARAEYTASNGNTLRIDIGPDGAVKFNARKGDHNQSVSVISAADVAALVAFVTSGGIGSA